MVNDKILEAMSLYSGKGVDKKADSNMDKKETFDVVDMDANGGNKIRQSTIQLEYVDEGFLLTVLFEDTWEPYVRIVTDDDSIEKDYIDLVEKMKKIHELCGAEKFEEAQKSFEEFVKSAIELKKKYPEEESVGTEVEEHDIAGAAKLIHDKTSNTITIKVNDEYLNFITKNLEKTASLDLSQRVIANVEYFKIDNSANNAETFEFNFVDAGFGKSAEKGELQIVRNGVEFGSFKASYDEYYNITKRLIFANLGDFGWKKDRITEEWTKEPFRNRKKAEAVIQNLFFDTIEELHAYQEKQKKDNPVVEEKKEELPNTETEVPADEEVSMSDVGDDTTVTPPVETPASGGDENKPLPVQREEKAVKSSSVKVADEGFYLEDKGFVIEEKDGKYGLRDEDNGDMVLPIEYDYIEDHVSNKNSGLLIVEKDGVRSKVDIWSFSDKGTSKKTAETEEEKQLAMGIKVEKEHADTIKWIKDFQKENGKFPPDEEVYKRIASDHLAEFSTYYENLKKMEDGMKKEDKQPLKEVASKKARLELKAWKGKLQKCYDNDFADFVYYNEMYNIAKRLGFSSADEAWDKNPTIETTTDPKDLKVIEDKKSSKKIATSVQNGNAYVKRFVDKDVYEYDKEFEKILKSEISDDEKYVRLSERVREIVQNMPDEEETKIESVDWDKIEVDGQDIQKIIDQYNDDVAVEKDYQELHKNDKKTSADGSDFYYDGKMEANNKTAAKEKSKGKCPNCGGKLVPTQSPAKTVREWLECEDCQLMIQTDKIKKQEGSQGEGEVEINPNVRMASKKEASESEWKPYDGFEWIGHKAWSRKIDGEEVFTILPNGETPKNADGGYLNLTDIMDLKGLSEKDIIAKMASKKKVSDRYDTVNDEISILISELREEGLGWEDIEEKVVGTFGKEWESTIKRFIFNDSRDIAASKKEAEFKNQTLQTEDIPKELVAQIRKIQETIPKEILDEKENEDGWINFGKQELLHVTVLFGVEQEEKDKITEIVKKYKEKGIKVSNETELKYFDNDNTAVYIPINGEDLTKLHDELKSSVKNKDEHDKFVGHICIAYLKKGKRIPVDSKVEHMEWEVKHIDITKKDGSTEKIARMKMAITEEPIVVGDILVNNSDKKEVKVTDIKDGYMLEDGTTVQENEIGEGKKYSRGIKKEEHIPWKQMVLNDKTPFSPSDYPGNNGVDNNSSGRGYV